MPNPFLSMFANSPFHPLQDHMNKVYDCAQLLEAFFAAVLAEDWQRAARVQHEIGQLEEEADALKRSIRLNLPDGLFMPVPRTDLLDLLGKQDRIANKAKDIAGLTLGRRMSIPAPLKESMLDFVQSSLRACRKAHQAIGELDELVETGFRGHEVKLVEKLILELDDAEDEADAREREVRAQLFSFEDQFKAVDVMFLYRIIDWVGDLANRAQEVGHRLHLMLAR